MNIGYFVPGWTLSRPHEETENYKANITGTTMGQQCNEKLYIIFNLTW